MTLRIFACLECNHCHNHFEDMVSIKSFKPDELSQEVHRLVLNAEDEAWECRRNATEHLCGICADHRRSPY